MSRRILAIAIIGSICGLAYQVSAARRSFDEARRFYEERQWDESQAAAAKALAADPQMGDAEILLGLIATARSQFSEAEKHFARAVALQPRNYQAHVYLGSTYMQEKRLGEAAATLRKALELNPDNATAHYNLGLVALAEGAPAKALTQFQAVVRANGSDVPALIGMMESQFAMHQTQDARQTADRLQALVDDHDPRLVQIASLLGQYGHSADAIPIMERSRRAYPQSYEVAYNLALACLQTAQYDRAVEVLQPFLGTQGKAEAFDLLGTIEEKRRRPENAERAFEEAAKREAGNEDYRFDFGNSLLQHGKPDAAVAAFRQTVADLPESWKSRVGLGSACYLAGDFESAAAALLEAVRLRPDSAAAYFLLGEAYDSVPRFQPAIAAAFARYLKGSPGDAWAYYHYGAILYTRAQAEGRDDCPEALASLNRALHLNPNLAEAHYELGLIALAQGKIEQSIAWLEKAVSLDPQLAAAHYRLGRAYQRQGDASRAKEELDRFRALKKEAPYGARVLESLAGMGH
jgi:tetratricopeptide (TPR) repeat protein